jgi:hypothetical protein
MNHHQRLGLELLTCDNDSNTWTLSDGSAFMQFTYGDQQQRQRVRRHCQSQVKREKKAKLERHHVVDVGLCQSQGDTAGEARDGTARVRHVRDVGLLTPLDHKQVCHKLMLQNQRTF